MNVHKIRLRLSTQWLGRKIHFQEEVPSTNDWARQEIQKGAARGEVFITDYQTQGRGRMKRSWESPRGKNILMSFLDDPPPEPSKNHELTLVSGVGLIESLKSYFNALHFTLKWPNDLLLAGKKVGGILSEATGPRVMIGVGINVNARESDFSAALSSSATSLYCHLSRESSRENLIVSCLEGYERWRGIYDEKGLVPVIEAWNEWSEILGRWVRIDEAGITYEGEAHSIDPDGFLVVKTREGLKRVVSGDLILLDHGPLTIDQ